MTTEIIPNNQPPRTDDDQTGGDKQQRGKKIVCECCESTLDPHGNLLRRGALAKQMLDAEDTIEDLKKQLKKAADDLASVREELSQARASVSETKPRSRFSLRADA